MSKQFLSLPPFASLQPFEAAARQGSFKRASIELSLSEAAVSRQIKRLEAELGTALFVREHRQVVLTECGVELADAVRRGLSEINRGAEAIRHCRPNGHVVMRIELYLAMYWLVPRLAAFHQANPDLRVQLVATTEPLTYAASDFDMAIQSSDRPAGNRLPMATAEEAILPICAPSYAASGALLMSDLVQCRRLSFAQMSGDSWLDWDDWMRSIGSTQALSEPEEIYDSYPVMIEAILAGQGVGLGWARGLGRLLNDGSLINPIGSYLHQPTGVSIYRGDEKSDNTEVERVFDWLTEQLSEPLMPLGR